MSGQRQKNRPEQGVLALSVESRSDAPKAAEQGTETLRAKHRTESLAGTERLMEEVCGLENCKQALQRVKANKGSPRVDGMTVDELPEYLKQHGLEIGEQLRNLAFRFLSYSRSKRKSSGRCYAMKISRAIPVAAAALFFPILVFAQEQEKKISRSDLPPAVEKTVAEQTKGAKIRASPRKRRTGKPFAKPR